MFVGYILASTPDLIESAVQAEFITAFCPVFRADPGAELPVILQEAPSSIIKMQWGLNRNKSPQYKEYYTPTSGIIKKPFYRILIRKSRCLIPANGILIRKGIRLYFIFSKKEKILTFAGIYHVWKNPDARRSVSSFSVLTNPDPFGISGERGMPVFIYEKRRRQFLKEVQPMMDILSMFKKASDGQFLFYEIRNDFLGIHNPTRKDILPVNGKIMSAQRQFKTIDTKRYFY